MSESNNPFKQSPVPKIAISSVMPSPCRVNTDGLEYGVRE